MKNPRPSDEGSTREPDTIRTFPTGATRDADNGKLDYEAFLSPPALKRYAEYMHKHRVQADGTLRDGDNWQKGIPIVQYMKSRYRHFMETWALHRGGRDFDPQQEDNLCAEIFNAFGMLHEILKAKKAAVAEQEGPFVIRHFSCFSAPFSGLYRIDKPRRLREGDMYLTLSETIGTATSQDEYFGYDRPIATFLGT